MLNNLLEYYRSGGGIMHFILVVAVIGLAVFLERLYTIVLRSKINGRAFIERVIQLVRSGKVEDAIKLCTQSHAVLPDMGLLILRSRALGVTRPGYRDRAERDRFRTARRRAAVRCARVPREPGGDHYRAGGRVLGAVDQRAHRSAGRQAGSP